MWGRRLGRHPRRRVAVVRECRGRRRVCLRAQRGDQRIGCRAKWSLPRRLPQARERASEVVVSQPRANLPRRSLAMCQRPSEQRLDGRSSRRPHKIVLTRRLGAVRVRAQGGAARAPHARFSGAALARRSGAARMLPARRSDASRVPLGRHSCPTRMPLGRRAGGSRVALWQKSAIVQGPSQRVTLDVWSCSRPRRCPSHTSFLSRSKVTSAVAPCPAHSSTARTVVETNHRSVFSSWQCL